MHIKEINPIRLAQRGNIVWKLLIGIAAGAAIGYLYYTFIGCAGGACPITSNPWSSMIYGAVIGALISRA